MSATGRSAVRIPNDAYETPAWCVDRLLDVLEGTLPLGRWLEPAAGTGAIIRAVNNHYKKGTLQWTAIELRPEYQRVLLYQSRQLFIGDYLKMRMTPHDVIITNPPYSLAEEFLRKSLQLSRHVLFLTRLNFLASERRAELFRYVQPDVYVLPNRPSFTGQGTDATEYAWLHFGPNPPQAQGKIQVLAVTPQAERQR